MKNEFYFATLKKADWDKFHKMDKKCFPHATINENSYGNNIDSNVFQVLIDETSKNFIGYFKINQYGKKGHIQRIAVHPDFQRKGYGNLLIKKAVTELEKRGCNQFFLYVETDNFAALNLYKKHHFIIKNEAWQFEIPFTKLPDRPRGKIMNIKKEKIEFFSNYFDVEPKRMEVYFESPNDQLILYKVNKKPIGFCRFTPSFPGAWPLKLHDLDYLYDYLCFLKKLITDDKCNSLKVTIDSNKKLKKEFETENCELKMHLYHMIKEKTSTNS